MSELNAPEVEEVKKLQEKVLGFEKLLQAFQKSQLEQAQALAAFVFHIGNDEKINPSATNIDANISTNAKANASTGIGLDKDTSSTISTMPNTNIGSNTSTSMGRKSSASSQYLQVQRKALKSAQQPQNTQTLARGKTVSKAAPYLGNVSSTLQTFDQDISIWAELSGIDEDTLKSNMKLLEERFIGISIPDPKAASDELRRAGFNFSWVPKEGYEEDDKPDDLRLPEFLSLVGGGHQPVNVHLRDFTDRSCEKVLYYESTDFESLWKALARPRKLGMKIKNTSIRSGWDKISAYEAINEDGENNLTYGREIVVRQLTPNVAIALLISSAYSGLKLEYVEPLDSLLNAMTIALSPEPHSLQDFVGYMNHDTFAFNAVFFELFDEDNPNQRKATVSASKSYGGKKFGSQWEGVFAPKNINRHSKPKSIRQTTLSLIFDSMATETGTNWTVTSIGEYSDDKAFGKPRNVKDVEKYTAPEEVFLDKLARVIDWAVDDGMWKVLDQLEMELGDRADALFFTEENEKLLFDDHQFSRTKRYHWALQWLKKMSDGINEFVTAIEEFEKISLPNLRRNAQAHRIRSRVRMAKAELSSEKVFERKVERAKKLRAKIEAKYSEIKDFRDALVSASGVLESRAAVSQAESMHTLTVLMIIFLPLTVVIALYSMPFMPETYQTLSAFGVTMGLVIMTTLILGLNLGSIILLFANKSQRFGTYLQSSMLVVGDSWAEKGKLLQDTDEAENLVRRGKRVPAELWYTWYCVVWIFFLLPATELYKIGGLRCLMNTGYVKMTASSQSNPPNYSEPLWAIAIIPLRIALLPVHFLTIVADYFLLMIFSKTLLGWDCSSGGFMPARAKPMSSRQGTIKGDVDLDEKTIPPWKQRLWDPIAILKEIPTRGIGRYRQPEDQIQNRSTSMDYSGNEEHTYSSMDLLLKDIVKNEKDIGSRTSTFSGSGTAFGGIKRSGPVEIVFSSSDVPDMNVGIRSGLISPTQSGRPLQSTSDAEQDPYTLPPILPESATSPALPIMSALSSNSSWELPHLKIVGRTMSRNREQEVDPERGEMQTFIIPE